MSEANLADQIDQVAERRGWFRPDNVGPFYNAVKSYMNGTTSLEDAVGQIVTPINEAYTSGDGGQAFGGVYSQEEAEEVSGASLPEAELPAVVEGKLSTEGMLWELWYSVLHMAKKTPRNESDAQERLVNLVRALKEQPNPKPPVNMTEALRTNWIWSCGDLWSNLLLLGPSARESWNDGPGCGARFQTVEIHAWTNVNAFVARLTRAGIADFWMYAIWAVRSGVEVSYEKNHHNAPASTQLDAYVPAAAAWVIVLGNALYNREEDLTPKNLNSGSPGDPGDLWKKRGGKPEFSKARWAFWKERFEALRSQEGLHQSTKDIAAEACTKMEECERDEAKF